MIHDFYTNTKNEIGEIESEIKNYETMMEEKEKRHLVNKKVYMQRVKHMEYQHGTDCSEVKKNAIDSMTSEDGDSKDKEKLMRVEKKELKNEYQDFDQANIQEIEDKEADLENNLRELKITLEMKKKNLISRYEKKL